MKAAKGHVFKYGDNVDTDVIIPARYLNSFDAQELVFYYDKPIYFFLIIYYSPNFEHFVHILFTNFSQSHHTIDTIQLYTLSIS